MDFLNDLGRIFVGVVDVFTIMFDGNRTIREMDQETVRRYNKRRRDTYRIRAVKKNMIDEARKPNSIGRHIMDHYVDGGG